MENTINEPLPILDPLPLSNETQQQSAKENHNLDKDMSHIKGWGIDANPKNDPTYPMRQRSEDSGSSVWERPALQTGGVEVLRSIERPYITATFGTASPPMGLSGIIRRLAFKLSEGSVGHWLSLLLADRVNVAEGLVSDIAKGQVPNVFAEKGIKAQWKHNPDAVIDKVVIGAAVIGAFMLIKHARKNRH